jgi:drug/metabolite transporter (DMT)-like permease
VPAPLASARPAQAGASKLFAICVAIWGTTWIAITFQLGRVPPEASVAWRFGLAALVVAGVCRARGLSLRFQAGTHALLALMGLAMFCVGYLFVYYAETMLVSGLVAVGYSASPLVNMVLSRLAFGVPMRRRVATGGLLGVAGVALVFWPELSRFQGGGRAALGAVLTAAGMTSAAVGNVFATALERRGVNVWQKMAWGMGYGAAGCLAAALIRGQPLAFEWTGPYLASLLYLSLFGSVLGFASFLTLLERIGAARAGYVNVMIPMVAVALSSLFEGFGFGPLAALGLAVAAAGQVLVLRPARAAAPSGALPVRPAPRPPG